MIHRKIPKDGLNLKFQVVSKLTIFLSFYYCQCFLGGGSSFLKKVVSQHSSESSSSEGANEKAITIVKSSLEPTRGILRDKSPQRLQGGGSFGKITSLYFNSNNNPIFLRAKIRRRGREKECSIQFRGWRWCPNKTFRGKYLVHKIFHIIKKYCFRRKIAKKKRVPLKS
jgi:hypothetical protein